MASSAEMARINASLQALSGQVAGLDERFCAVDDKLECLDKKSREIKECLTGDLDGTPGLITEVNELKNARASEKRRRDRHAYYIFSTMVTVAGGILAAVGKWFWGLFHAAP